MAVNHTVSRARETAPGPQCRPFRLLNPLDGVLNIHYYLALILVMNKEESHRKFVQLVGI